MLPDSQAVVKAFVKAYGWQGPVFAISAISGLGCKELVYAIMQHIDDNRKLVHEALDEQQSQNPEPKNEIA
jgi:GTP-binding protein